MQLCGVVSKMTSAETLMRPNLLCLPGNAFNDIASWLDEEDLCSLELANKTIHIILSSPSRPGPGERQLNLQPTFNPNARSQAGTRTYSPEALRSPGDPLNFLYMQYIHEVRYHSMNCFFAQHIRVL